MHTLSKGKIKKRRKEQYLRRQGEQEINIIKNNQLIKNREKTKLISIHN